MGFRMSIISKKKYETHPCEYLNHASVEFRELLGQLTEGNLEESGVFDHPIWVFPASYQQRLLDTAAELEKHGQEIHWAFKNSSRKQYFNKEIAAVLRDIVDYADTSDNKITLQWN